MTRPPNAPDAPDSPIPGGSGADVPIKDSLFFQVRRMGSAFWSARERNMLLMLCAALIAVTGATAYAQIRLNAWNRPFYDALTNKDLAGFVRQLGVFGILASILLALNVAQMWLNQTSRVVLRQGLGHDLLDAWLKPMRAFRLSNAGWIGLNPDQRMHADAQHLTELTTELGIGLLQATLLLLSFIGVLWVLSRDMTLPLTTGHVHVPGYMVWCALLYAGTASFLSWRVGRPLIALDAERYAREADMRFELVRTNEEVEGITIYGGEADEREHLERVFEAVLAVSRRIVSALTRLTWVTAGYGWFTIVAPILVAAPSYMSGHMSFGELMMVVGAFNQVQTSLRWFVDNFSNLADWRATLLRVASFRTALLDLDALGGSASRIRLEESAGGSIEFDDLRIAAPAGCINLSERSIELGPGERVLIEGERSAGRNLLFRAIVGIWPWGSGRIRRPQRRAVMFLPARAYVPPGTLRGALAYPRGAKEYENAAVTEAMKAVGLERLVPQLDTRTRWDRRLSDEEKQCLAFARLMLHRPQWAVLNGALDILDSDSRARIEALLSGPLAGLGVIDIGQDRGEEGFFRRKLRLEVDPRGPAFRPPQELRTARAAPAIAAASP
ncbi:MAG: ABC transporter ATP-binding protein/permease [Gammaproteobacteria bacterium]|nr:ABC transporter ATP-binding protein/permease [Gammaproteobacteria bacterium]